MLLKRGSGTIGHIKNAERIECVLTSAFAEKTQKPR
jgi:hypothetical protein